MGDMKIDINDLDEPWMSRRKRLEALASSFTGEVQQKEAHVQEVNREARDQEVKTLMNSEIYQSIKKKDDADVFIGILEAVSFSENLSLSAILRQVTPSESSLLHVAARHGSGDIIQLLAQFLPKLIFGRNNEGDTPLHEAAREGQLEATKMLIRFAKDNGGNDDTDDHGEPFVSKKNYKWNTALHLAVMHGRLDVANVLASEDIEVCYSLNKDGSSPLCWAVSKRNINMFDCLLDALIKFSPKCDKFQGMPPVHLAMIKKAEDILTKIADKLPELLHVRDEKGENPLHYASWIGYVEGVEFMLEKNSKAELETNKDGNYPIHLACKKGHVDVLKKLLERWIENPSEFLNKKGQNILHIAADNGQDRVITHIFEKIKGDKLEKLLNQRDEDGNMPLHLATTKGHCIAVYSLVKAKGMKKKMRNNQMLTSYDIASAQARAKEKELEKDDKGGAKQEAERHVQITDAHTDAKKQKLIKGKRKSITENSKCSVNYYSALMTFAILHFHAKPKRTLSLVAQLRTMFTYPASKEEISKKIENLLVVAVLIAGATFAGALQLPGDDKNIKKAKWLAGHADTVLTLYLIINMVSLNLAVIAFIILCWSSALSTKISTLTVTVASILISASIYYMSLAFSFALIIDLGPYITSFKVVVAVLTFFLSVQTLVALPFLLTSNVIRFIEQLVAPCLYYRFFRIYMLVHPCVSAMDRRLRRPHVHGP